MSDTDRTYTYRCGVCSINWPYYRQLATCPICGERCAPLTLMLKDGDRALTVEEANARLLAEGTRLRIYPRPDDEAAPTQKPKKGRKPSRQELAEFAAELDAWAREVPWWAR